MGIIELDNGYYIELIEDGKCKDDRIQNIQTIKLRESRNKGCLLLYIDFREFDKDRYKKILRKLLHIKKMVKFLKINIGVNQDSKIKIGYINNYDENNQYHQEFIQAINAILFNTKKKGITTFTILCVTIWMAIFMVRTFVILKIINVVKKGEQLLG